MAAPPPVQVAHAGDLVGAHPRSHRDCVAGGVPAFPGEGAPAMVMAGGRGGDPPAHPTTLPPPCRRCGSPTAQVIQVHAPLPGQPERVLYLFCCVGEACAGEAGAWVGLRAGVAVAASGEGVEEEAAAAQPAAPAPPPPPPPPASTVFGGGGDGWSSEGEGDDDSAPPPTTAPPPLDLASLAAELSAAGAALAAGGGAGKKARGGGGGGAQGQESEGGGATAPSWSPPAIPTTLPCFWLGWAAEPGGDPPPPPAEDAHIAALLAAYRAEEGGGSEAEETLPGGPEGPQCSPAPQGGAPAAAAPTAAVASWAGEAYEPDAAPGVDPAYLRFAARIGRAPGQVARYYYYHSANGGSTAEAAAALPWPAPGGPPGPPPCPLCGGARTPELQVVAPLAAMLEEAAAWEADAAAGEGGSGGGGGERGSSSVPPPKAWQWLSVVLWACGCEDKGGGGGGGGRGWVVEEAVGVVNEE